MSSTYIRANDAHVDTGNPLPVLDATVAEAILAAALTPPVQTRAQSILVTDLTSQAITTTANGATLPLDSGNTFGAVVNVSAVSGTNPTLDLMLQESLDGGVTFNDIYHLARITTTGTITVPTMLLTGTRRWRWVVGGTATPTFTLSIIATRGTGTAPLIRNFVDRTIVANTLGSTSPAWNVGGCRNIQIFVSNGTVTTTAAVFQAQYSPDNNAWANYGNTVTPGNNSSAMTSMTGSHVYARIGVVTAGTGDTVNYVSFYGTN